MKDLVHRMNRYIEEGGTDAEADALNKEAADLDELMSVLDPNGALDEPEARA
ncbi:hypothetical protein [Myxococcus sp. AS-1-15]|uniref:hypothetical protein n=1 Tax=Myxococcus sp. AS-1-15 TaxID=2874600 RepID=UPI001CBE4745|nr:hypothetical protein [Myxococcus sp. AS-1-15]MBZ4402007.1 hypothetical protein [Myxococcus sp. AS-1-15]